MRNPQTPERNHKEPWGRRLAWIRIHAWGACDPGFKSQRPHHSSNDFELFLSFFLIASIFLIFYLRTCHDHGSRRNRKMASERPTMGEPKLIYAKTAAADLPKTRVQTRWDMRLWRDIYPILISLRNGRFFLNLQPTPKGIQTLSTGAAITKKLQRPKNP